MSAGAPRADEPVQALLAQVGRRLRARRAEQGRTLADVAGAAGVSVSHLSAIEAGGSVPSLPVLGRVVHALGLALGDVLGGAGGAPVAHGRLDPDAAGVAPLSAAGMGLRVLRLRAEPGEAGGAPLAAPADGALLVHVRAGRLEVSVDGAAHELGPGDALHAARAAAVSWRALAAEPSLSVWATTRAPGRERS